jgi:hypothetical protein
MIQCFNVLRIGASQLECQISPHGQVETFTETGAREVS